MPQLKIGNILFQILLLLSLIAITGHLTGSYMERHAIKNEISHIRNSLHNLKDTINNIGTTYDNLYTDIKNFVIPKDVNDLKIPYKVTDGLELNEMVMENFNANIEKDNLTRHSVKATGVGSESVKVSQCPIRKECKMKSNIHKCYRDFKICSCNYSYWQF